MNQHRGTRLQSADEYEIALLVELPDVAGTESGRLGGHARRPAPRGESRERYMVDCS